MGSMPSNKAIRTRSEQKFHYAIFLTLYFGHTPTEICGNILYLFFCVLTCNLTGALPIRAEKGRKRPTYLTK
jgi:hypothetical protein